MTDHDDARPRLQVVGGTGVGPRKVGTAPLKLAGGTAFDQMQSSVPVQHRGVLFSRTLPKQHPQENTRCIEAGFVEEWSERNQERPFLEQLLCTDEDDPRRDSVPRNKREWEIAHLVAASVIQWLPTSIGCSFLQSAFRRGGGDFRYRLPDWEKFSY